jgi:hypothetical protein
MSNWIVSKTDIDALVSVAFRWTEAGALQETPPSVVELLTVTDSNATKIGVDLWRANHDTCNYGGPLSQLDLEQYATWDADPPVEMPTYDFEPLPGSPRPQTAIRLAGYYSYQTAHDFWQQPDWPNGEPPFEMLFHQAIVWTAVGLLGLPRPPTPSDYSPYESDVPDSVIHDPIYEATPWGPWGPAERDVFVRLSGL